MAEAVILFIRDSIGRPFIRQVKFLVGVKDQVEDLQRELLTMQIFLQDADSRQNVSSLVRTCVSEVRDAAYDIEDIIDTYILTAEDDHPPRRRRFLGYLKKYVCICQKWENLYSIGNEVKAIKSRIEQTRLAIQNYRINDFGSRSVEQLRRSFPYDDAIDKDIVGLDEKVKELVNEVLMEEGGCRCISITGMGGIGKTALATKIYNCEIVECHFEYRAWVHVSKEFNAKDIFKRLIKEVEPNLTIKELEEMELVDDKYLQGKLHQLLKNSASYLVVLDDIWDVEAWVTLNKAFPQNNKYGRVILTSRNIKVASGGVVHQLSTLNESDSWKLFVVKAFGSDDCPANLEVLGKEMVKKYDGLPLAITMLAGLLSGKSPQEWFIVRDRLHQQLMKGEYNLEKILSFSHNDLPYQLKACYLYIGLFPEDHTIFEAEELIRLWVAEGFIRCEGEEIMEDVAMDYWNELISRSMLTVVSQNDLGEVLSCRIHYLLRDICISKGQEESFLDYSPRATSTSSSTTSIVCKSRRYAIHSSAIERFDFTNLSNSHLRTLLLFNPNEESLQQQQLESISNIRLLKVLDLSNVNFQGKRLPDAFGKLIHLRYLRMKNAKAKLPSSIKSLRSLQTLDLDGSDCHWSDIAEDALSKLTQLRHLLLSDRYWDGLDRGVGLARFDTLTNLQTLWMVDALIWEQNKMTNLINLRKLRIKNIGASDVESMLSSIGELAKIKILSLQLSAVGSPEYAFPMLVHLSHCHLLQYLTLFGKIERLPEDPYHEFPPRLIELCLEYSRLGPEAMAILEKLPNLIRLNLWKNSIMGKKIVCSAQGFPQLQVFYIKELETKEWEIKEGALPKLNHLSICNCNNLKKIPMGLMFVATLQVLDLIEMPQEFQDRFDRGEDAHEIGHFPSSIKINWMRR